MSQSSQVMLVIDTRQYSGNFEREMCAYMTGQVGECNVGHRATPLEGDVEDDHPDIPNAGELYEWICDHVEQVEDEGCSRPCSIWTTPGRTNNGSGVHSDITEDNPLVWPAYESVAIYFDDVVEADVLHLLVERAKMYAERKNLTIVGYRVLEQRTIRLEHTIINVTL